MALYGFHIRLVDICSDVNLKVRRLCLGYPSAAKDAPVVGHCKFQPVFQAPFMPEPGA